MQAVNPNPRKILPFTPAGNAGSGQRERLRIAEVIELLCLALLEHGDLPCVCEGLGVVSPAVRRVRGEKVFDLAAP